MGQMVDSQAKGRSMLSLWMLVLIFAIPSTAAWFFYLNPEMLPQGRTNRGELIGTPVSVVDISLKTPRGKTLELAVLQTKWTLLAIGDDSCSNRCQQQVFESRQISKALAENGSRLERVLIIPEPGEKESLQQLMASYPETHIAWANSDLLNRLSRTIGKEQKLFNTAWIIDPRGELMMYYTTEATAEDILSDLEKLMKASKSWGKGGQYGHQ